MYNFYNSAVFISSGDCFSDQSSIGSLIQLGRVQSSSFSIDFGRESIEYSDSSVEDQKFNTPTVSFTSDYLVTNGKNESAIGLSVNSLTGALLNVGQLKNIYVISADEGDANSNLQDKKINVYGIGNCLITSYSVNGSVGSLLTANFGAEGLNVISYTGTPLNLIAPTLNDNGALYENSFSIFSGSSLFDKLGDLPDQIAALGKGDINMEIPINFGFSTNMSGAASCAIQDFSLSVNLQNEPVYQIGKPVPKREINMPILMELNCSAILEKIQADSIIKECEDSAKDIKITVNQPCSDFVAIQFLTKGMKLQSQEIVESIFDRVKVSFSWRGYISSIKSLNSNFIIKGADSFLSDNQYALEQSSEINGVDSLGQTLIDEELIYGKV
jgi:hypothetical protein